MQALVVQRLLGHVPDNVSKIPVCFFHWRVFCWRKGKSVSDNV
jgi:hypothetical protein